MNNRTKTALIILAAGCFCLGEAAAELKPDYQTGTDQLGKSMLTDFAKLGGDDYVTENSGAETSMSWVAEMADLWNPGDRVTLTGIAIPLRAETAAPIELTFTFFDLGGNNAYDPDDVIVGKVKESYPGGDTSVWYAKFEVPVTFIAKGSGVAVSISGTEGPIWIKINTMQNAPGIVRKYRKNGEPMEEFPNFAMSLAGTVEKKAK